jgi:hypothetical protein
MEGAAAWCSLKIPTSWTAYQPAEATDEVITRKVSPARIRRLIYPSRSAINPVAKKP